MGVLPIVNTTDFELYFLSMLVGVFSEELLWINFFAILGCPFLFAGGGVTDFKLSAASYKSNSLPSDSTLYGWILLLEDFYTIDSGVIALTFCTFNFSGESPTRLANELSAYSVILIIWENY